MFDRISRGWGIVKASWAVLKLHPKLLVLPILSTLALLLLVGSIATSAYLGATGQHARQLFDFFDQFNPDDPIVYVLGFAFYFVCSFVVIFFNAALVFCALESFAGRAPSLRAGLATAVGRLPQILAWTFVAATVGLLLNALENFLRDRLGFLGSLLGGILETGWAVLTYFVVPVLVVDGVGPVQAVQRSSEVLKRTWGESLTGEGGLGLISFLMALPAFALILLGCISGPSNEAVFVGAIALGILYFIALAVVFATLGAIFRTGTYIYATTGKAPSSMDAALLQTAFRPKS